MDSFFPSFLPSLSISWLSSPFQCTGLLGHCSLEHPKEHKEKVNSGNGQSNCISMLFFFDVIWFYTNDHSFLWIKFFVPSVHFLFSITFELNDSFRWKEAAKGGCNLEKWHLFALQMLLFLLSSSISCKLHLLMDLPCYPTFLLLPSSSIILLCYFFW